jgi:hypothetical protein
MTPGIGNAECIHGTPHSMSRQYTELPYCLIYRTYYCPPFRIAPKEESPRRSGRIRPYCLGGRWAAVPQNRVVNR